MVAAEGEQKASLHLKVDFALSIIIVFIIAELRFVATVTTSSRVKFVPVVKIFPENNASFLHNLHITTTFTHTKCDFALKL